MRREFKHSSWVLRSHQRNPRHMTIDEIRFDAGVALCEKIRCSLFQILTATKHKDGGAN